MHREELLDTEEDVQPPGTLSRPQGQATVSVVPVLTLESVELIIKLKATTRDASGIKACRLEASSFLPCELMFLCSFC